MKLRLNLFDLSSHGGETAPVSCVCFAPSETLLPGPRGARHVMVLRGASTGTFDSAPQVVAKFWPHDVEERRKTTPKAPVTQFALFDPREVVRAARREAYGDPDGWTGGGEGERGAGGVEGATGEGTSPLPDGAASPAASQAPTPVPGAPARLVPYAASRALEDGSALSRFELELVTSLSAYILDGAPEELGAAAAEPTQAFRKTIDRISPGLAGFDLLARVICVVGGEVGGERDEGGAAAPGGAPGAAGAAADAVAIATPGGDAGPADVAGRGARDRRSLPIAYVWDGTDARPTLPGWGGEADVPVAPWLEPSALWRSDEGGTRNRGEAAVDADPPSTSGKRRRGTGRGEGGDSLPCSPTSSPAGGRRPRPLEARRGHATGAVPGPRPSPAWRAGDAEGDGPEGRTPPDCSDGGRGSTRGRPGCGLGDGDEHAGSQYPQGLLPSLGTFLAVRFASRSTSGIPRAGEWVLLRRLRPDPPGPGAPSATFHEGSSWLRASGVEAEERLQRYLARASRGAVSTWGWDADLPPSAFAGPSGPWVRVRRKAGSDAAANKGGWRDGGAAKKGWGVERRADPRELAPSCALVAAPTAVVPRWVGWTSVRAVLAALGDPRPRRYLVRARVVRVAWSERPGGRRRQAPTSTRGGEGSHRPRPVASGLELSLEDPTGCLVAGVWADPEAPPGAALAGFFGAAPPSPESRRRAVEALVDHRPDAPRAGWGDYIVAAYCLDPGFPEGTRRYLVDGTALTNPRSWEKHPAELIGTWR